MRPLRVLGAAAFVLGVVFGRPDAAGAQMQVERGEWRVLPEFGVYTYDSSTPFETAAFVGGQAHYALTSNVAVGLNVSFSRPEVDGSYYPLAIMQFAPDTTLLFEVAQQVTQVTYSVVLSAGKPFGKLYGYALAGVGGYTFFLDPQVMSDVQQLGAPSSISGLLLPLGIGASYAIGPTLGFRLEARDEILTGFDRDDLNPVEPRFQNTCEVRNFCIPEANGSPPPEKSTSHNLRFMIGFEFLPGR